ncbi:MAG TPA: glucokinase [Desulfocapsa sulfexigens]|nr:glucokinase [Desulfocapsa sulfexigens]
MACLLAADIGGTKSDLAIFDLSHTADSPPVRRKRYHNREFQNFDAILIDFLGNSETPEFGCFSVAAVIHQGTAALTNRDWIVSEKELKHSFGFKEITLINDLTAICSALPFLPESELLMIQPGVMREKGVRAVIAPGTGLGEGFLIEQESCFFPQGSEGGHCDFAPLNDEQAELLNYMQKKHTAVSYELLCSGVGIPNIFDYLESTGIDRDQKYFDKIAVADDRTPPIIEGAVAKTPCTLCQKTLSLFLEILGAEAGNLALKLYPTGGLFIGGGILPRIAEQISFDSFLENFRQKEKMDRLMKTFPIYLIFKKDAALLGTASYGRLLFYSGK